MKPFEDFLLTTSRQAWMWTEEKRLGREEEGVWTELDAHAG